ncbi:ATP synthase protein 8 [Golovinomyces cichoracearum]|uniref:ATP synthase protein 8 n=1 Tax=Golovinomyces cichoracearum TaxID=62708 RepID=A0A420I7K4_9PEZI|nr:ATP synthase protein 8 [Golovinomyces cichoracearum]
MLCFNISMVEQNTSNILIQLRQGLIPFFFVNQVIFTFVILTVLIYTFTKFILPSFVRTFISRIYINKL